MQEKIEKLNAKNIELETNITTLETDADALEVR
jgi:cell division protein FtsB